MWDYDMLYKLWRHQLIYSVTSYILIPKCLLVYRLYLCLLWLLLSFWLEMNPPLIPSVTERQKTLVVTGLNIISISDNYELRQFSIINDLTKIWILIRYSSKFIANVRELKWARDDVSNEYLLNITKW